MLHEYCQNREEKGRRSSDHSCQCHYRSASISFETFPQVSSYNKDHFPAVVYTGEWNTTFPSGSAGACRNSLERLHWWQRAGGQGGGGQAREQQSLAHTCHCPKTGTARETQRYKLDDLWGSAERLFWSEHTTAVQVGWFYCSWYAVSVLHIKSNYKV